MVPGVDPGFLEGGSKGKSYCTVCEVQSTSILGGLGACPPQENFENSTL